MGFCTLTETSEILYKVDNYYSKEHELGLLWNDNNVNINWPVENPILSEKDKNNIILNEFIKNYKWKNINEYPTIQTITDKKELKNVQDAFESSWIGLRSKSK